MNFDSSDGDRRKSGKTKRFDESLLDILSKKEAAPEKQKEPGKRAAEEPDAGKYRFVDADTEEKIVGEPEPPKLVVKKGFVGKIEEAHIKADETVLYVIRPKKIDDKDIDEDVKLDPFPLSMVSFHAVPYSRDRADSDKPEDYQKMYARLGDNSHIIPEVSRAMLEKIIDVTKLAERGTGLFDIVMKELEELREKENEIRKLMPWNEGSLWVCLRSVKNARVNSFDNQGCYLIEEGKDEEKPENEIFEPYGNFKWFPKKLRKRLEENPIGTPLTIVTYCYPTCPDNLYGLKQNYVRAWPSMEYWAQKLKNQERSITTPIPALLLSPEEIAGTSREKVSPQDVNEMIEMNTIASWNYSNGQNRVSIEEVVLATLYEIKGEECKRNELPDLRGADEQTIKEYLSSQFNEFMEVARGFYHDHFEKHPEKKAAITEEELERNLKKYAETYAQHWTAFAQGFRI